MEGMKSRIKVGLASLLVVMMLALGVFAGVSTSTRGGIGSLLTGAYSPTSAQQVSGSTVSTTTTSTTTTTITTR